tara:strand:+ start:903 stop:1115 length:213 start_codon:yes stop_codon:yes gene_type:complete
MSPVVATVGDTWTEIDCPMCQEEFIHMGMKITTHNGYVMLPIEQTRKNVEGGRESITKWSGETLPEKGKE